MFPLTKPKKLLKIQDAVDGVINAMRLRGCTESTLLHNILNSFSVPYTNGFIEGCNNKIKVLKRNAYGYKNFKRFRNRILHMFSHQQGNEQAAA